MPMYTGCRWTPDSAVLLVAVLAGACGTPESPPIRDSTLWLNGIATGPDDALYVADDSLGPLLVNPASGRWQRVVMPGAGGDTLFYVATAQLEAIRSGGTMAPADSMRENVILRLVVPMP